jgi:hypothetical protein
MRGRSESQEEKSKGNQENRGSRIQRSSLEARTYSLALLPNPLILNGSVAYCGGLSTPRSFIRDGLIFGAGQLR